MTATGTATQFMQVTMMPGTMQSTKPIMVDDANQQADEQDRRPRLSTPDRAIAPTEALSPVELMTPNVSGAGQDDRQQHLQHVRRDHSEKGPA